jgi:hypothetical protein
MYLARIFNLYIFNSKDNEAYVKSIKSEYSYMNDIFVRLKLNDYDLFSFYASYALILINLVLASFSEKVNHKVSFKVVTKIRKAFCGINRILKSGIEAF